MRCFVAPMAADAASHAGPARVSVRDGLAARARLLRERFARRPPPREPEQDTAWLVVVERRGAAPLRTQLLVRAPTPAAAGELAACLAEGRCGGLFAARKARPAPAGRPLDFDDPGL